MSRLSNLQQPFTLGSLKLKNRVIMSSLTRNRNLIPAQVNVDYYTQRVGSGLIMTEGVLVEPQGTEWPEAPGIWSKPQVEGWKKIVDSVHSNKGLIYAQLWHVGRAAHTLHNCGVPPPAPSAVKANAGKFRLLVGNPSYSVPQAIEDPKKYVEIYKKAAVNAKQAGFDGIELHAANGYLPNQFLESHSNKRDDGYGGSIENRARFILEIIDIFTQVYNSKNVGIKLSPSGGYNDMGEGDESKTLELYGYLIDQLNLRNIGHIQLVRYNKDQDSIGRGTAIDLKKLTDRINGPAVILNGMFTGEEADQFIKDKKADAVAFGTPYIANPDLAERFFNGYNLSNPIDFKSFYIYENDEKHVGYSDYSNYS